MNDDYQIRWKDTPEELAREQRERREKVAAEKELARRQSERWAKERERDERNWERFGKRAKKKHFV